MVFAPEYMLQRLLCCAASEQSPVEEFEKAVLCDPDTGANVLVISTISTEGVSVAAYNIDGSAYAGDIGALEACASDVTESDPVLMCDGGETQFYRWFLAENGQPTGDSFDTDLAGAAYVPAGQVTPGDCPCVSSETPLSTF
jgi:hypothetical protein